eukprot:1778029-Pyramimonas_sp.AAC.1
MSDLVRMLPMRSCGSQLKFRADAAESFGQPTHYEAIGGNGLSLMKPAWVRTAGGRSSTHPRTILVRRDAT